ncbi:FAD-dependent monooxygenase [Streptosporangium sp. NPDC049376]|uniref:FAD-dependent monooxygenase n=1 Tax=Streptosporangium sp. NPDC049376 TaxID=3366192 RepID=UPI0037B4A52A
MGCSSWPGIAGPALAFWLHRHGMHPVVIERFPRLRPGGQTVDIRGAGQSVTRLMGIEEAIRASSTGEEGIRFLDAADRTRAAFSSAAFGGRGFVTELEILRGELSALLYERTRRHTEYVFGDEISEVHEEPDHLRLAFKSGAERKADLLVAADGIRSRTRDLVFGDTTRIRSCGLYTAYFTIPRHPSDDDWARWYNFPGGKNVTLRPDNLGTIRALMSFLSPPHGYDRLHLEEQKELMRRTFAGLGGPVPRMLREMRACDDFYLEGVAQLHMPRWSRGRVAAVGDAAYCASPLSGMGTNLALVGAYIPAGELATHDDHRDAFATYESTLRPYVAQAQNLPPGTPRLALPRTQRGIRVLHTVLRTASTPPVSQVVRRFLVPAAHDFELPVY